MTQTGICKQKAQCITTQRDKLLPSERQAEQETIRIRIVGNGCSRTEIFRRLQEKQQSFGFFRIRKRNRRKGAVGFFLFGDWPQIDMRRERTEDFSRPFQSNSVQRRVRKKKRCGLRV